jgi:hypothetical protein
VETRVLGSVLFDASIRDTAGTLPFVVPAPRSATAEELARIASRALVSATRPLAVPADTREAHVATAVAAR